MEQSSECGITTENEDGTDIYDIGPMPWESPGSPRSRDRFMSTIDPLHGLEDPFTGSPTDIRIPSAHSVDSGIGLVRREPAKKRSHGRESDSRSNSRPLLPPDTVPNEAVSKATNQFQTLSTPPEPSYNSQLSPRLSVSSPQGIALSKGKCSPLGSETTDSGDTEMNVDEESLFDDHDVHLYTERKWDEATIQRLEHIYKQSLYSLVDSQVLHRRKGYQVYGTSSRDISVPSSPSHVGRKRTKTGCLTCRRRRIKCGEERPKCNNCIETKRECEGYIPWVVFEDRIGKLGAYNNNQAVNALVQPMPSAATNQSKPNATGSAGVQETNLVGRDGTSSGRKRKADEISDDDGHGGHYEGDGNGSQEPSKRFKPSKSEDRPLRLACPFFKRHPESFRTCGMSDHENSSRVKQHISRKHRMPIYCPRCSETFKTEHERDTHVRDADCPVGPKANFICATAEQLRNLSRRNAHQTDRENWNAIYNILFPDDPLPDSPYLDPLVSYEVNLVREAFLAAAPVAVRTAIQQVIPEEFSDTVQEELERVLRSTHAEVFDNILRRMREDREPGRAHRTTTQSSLQTRVSSTPDSGIGSTVRSGSSQDEPEPTADSQDRLTSFGSGSFDFHNDEAIPLLTPSAPGFDLSEYRMGHLSQPFPDGTFDDLLEYLDAPGDSFLTDQS
ncbi:hypothetical protein CNMCM5793_005833 [Aspergillus hiratsukae]|uniref:Zn(2)-C6 fungal-type domain-containing protein n=1 Tax=Aspergillus hiratsukae TaxID=1194566 RepID=A0A8H6QH04_9EURO|nr:hypothetical protein CNMCM5793_005833 [Aspergillus hiratsukae]KAF7172339.1 hypothetical protein CNMCM6106_006566 [Aspergillus hiratsukae]